MAKIAKETVGELKPKFSWVNFLFGAAVGACVGGVIGTLVTKSVYVPLLEGAALLNTPKETDSPNSDATEESSKSEVDEEQPDYQTDIKEFTITPEDGTSFNFHTPEGWYSLSDQYLESLDSYYMTELPKDNAVCVGNNPDQYSADTVINARPLSSISATLKAIYQDEYDEETMLYGDAYTYLTTGSLPEESAEANVTCELVEEVNVGDAKFSILKLGYDTEYAIDDETEETQTVHTDELVAYSDTEDTMEIILYMQSFEQESALSYLKEFLGVTE